MREYTQKELELLHEIMTNKYANGAFAGMIFNACIANRDLTTDEAIQKALQVRLKLQQVADKHEEKLQLPERGEDEI